MKNNWQNKVGYLVGCFPSTSETFILNEMEELEKNEINIRFFSLSHNARDVLHDLAKKWVTRTYWTPSLFSPALWLAHLHFALVKPKEYFPALGHIKEFGGKRSFLKAIYFARVVEIEEIHHIYAQFGWCAGAAMLIGYLTGVGFSFILHATDIFFVPPSNIKQLVNQSQFCVTVSHYNKRYLTEKWSNINPDKIKVIHLGVDIKKFAPVDKDATVKKRVDLLNVARLEKLKNIPFLISICKELKEKKYDFNCIVVGEGHERVNLEKQITKLGLEDCIHLVGKKSQEKIVTIYQNADIFIMTSISEGIPVAAMEAMASGLPVVAPRIKGIPELVIDGHTGLLFSAGNLEQATDAIAKLIQDADLRAQFGIRGREKIISDFNIHANVAQLAKLYLEALKN